MLSELDELIKSELDKYRKKKEKIQQEINQLPIYIKNNQNCDEQNELKQTLIKNRNSFDELTTHTKKIEQSVDQISDISRKALKDFEKLKYRKINVENLLNTMTAYTELNRIIPLLQDAIQQKNIDECLKHAKNYDGFKNYLLPDFSEHLIHQLHQLLEKLKDLTKSEFQSSLKENNAERLNKCSALTKILGFEETSLEKIIEVYSFELKDNLKKIDEQMFQAVPTSYKNDLKFNQYNQPFLEFFEQTLEKLNNSITTYKDNIYQFYKLDGLLKMLSKFINDVADSFITSILKKQHNYFEIDKLPVDGKTIKLENEDLQRINFFCEELSNISYQNENFNRHLYSIIEELIQQQSQNSQFQQIKQDILNENQIKREIEQFASNKRILEVMGDFIIFEQMFLRNKVQNIIEVSPSFKCLWNFDKNFYLKFADKEESLINIPNIYDFLDEIFFLIRTSAEQALETQNRTCVCALLNYITNNLLYEDLYYFMSNLLQKYIKREYFSPQAISFNQKYSVHNAFIIILFNNVEMVIKYLKKLRQALLSKYEEKYKVEQNKMIVSCIEELSVHNEKRFNQLIKEKMGILVEMIKLTLKSMIEDFKNINFIMNEQLIQEYEKNSSFSAEFRNKMSLYIQQWRVQYTKDNFDLFLILFCENLAKTLENYIMNKKFNQIGSILLDKEIRSIIMFFQNISSTNVKPQFTRLSLMCEILMLESQKDMEEFYNLGAGEFSMDDIKRIVRLRSDFKN